MYKLSNEELAKIVEDVFSRCFSDFHGNVKNVEIRRCGTGNRLIGAYCNNILLCPIDLGYEEIRMFIKHPKMIRVVTKDEINNILGRE